ncbi:MAG: outer membrane beta-barrel protein [Flavobacteriaceae bacterium]|nr:outer membrane beta-barrel protein [Flavobacteriaceae bacterium]MCY4266572.1 outer membrane beta-barrel protein [Flavobacteriaceae bacterium]MCY4297800.1 outer membrane beta-barrel protein [Flavobacteriaceae bacterium]
MIQKNILLSTLSVLLTVCAIGFGYSQEEADSKWNFSGTVDVYGRFNLADEQKLVPGTSFANLPGFALGMFNGVFSYEGEKVGFVADLVYGPRGKEAVFNETGSSNILNQLYVYANLSESTTLTVGNFNTFLGYEVISPAGNFHYSTSYMFSYGPFSHGGVKLDHAFSDDFSLMLGVFNGTDLVDFNRDDDYTYGAQLGIKGQYINYLGGEGFNQIDFTGGIPFGDSFNLGINATLYKYDLDGEESDFKGIALYPQYDFSDTASFGFRFELFDETGDATGVFGVPEASNVSYTATGSFAVDDLTIKPEIRLDSASEEIFDDSDSLFSVLVALVYSF